MEPILTPRLILREMEPSDLEFMATMLADAAVMRFWPAPLDRTESIAWINRQRERYAHDGCGYWLALERRKGQPVGQAGVLMLDWSGKPEPVLGYMIHRPFWRMGYATEAARACCDFIRDAIRRQVIYTLIRPENEPSLAVARKLGLEAGERIQHYGFEHIVFSMHSGLR